VAAPTLLVMTEAPFLTTARDFYDTIADEYAARFEGELPARPWARAVLRAFAEQVGADGGPVVEAGSGPGRVTAFLHSLGLEVRGVDLSPRMVAIARRAHPGVRYDEGSMTALDVPDGSLAAIVAWYSLIHVPPAEVPAVLAGFRRALRPGGRLLLAFQVGDEPRRHERVGTMGPVALDFHRIRPERLEPLLVRAGFAVEATLMRAPAEDEVGPQAHLSAYVPAA
jgi:SAM-dependent methyltransferase